MGIASPGSLKSSRKVLPDDGRRDAEDTGGRAGSGRGCFLAFEGPEGAGKSLQIRRLAARLRAAGIPSVSTREPGGTSAGDAIRDILLNRSSLSLGGVSELLLFSASRWAHVQEVIRPALERGEVVLCDRFELSTRVYQGCARGVPMETIQQVTSVATGGLYPDLYIVLDVLALEGLSRTEERPGETSYELNVEGLSRKEELGGEPDRIEREGRAFMEVVREGYLRLAEGDDRIVVINGTAGPDEVERDIFRTLSERFPKTFAMGRQ